MTPLPTHPAVAHIFPDYRDCPDCDGTGFVCEPATTHSYRPAYGAYITGVCHRCRAHGHPSMRGTE